MTDYTQSYYTQDCSGALSTNILPDKIYKSSLGFAREGVRELRRWGEQGRMKMLEAALSCDDITTFNALGTFYRRFHSVFVIGMGGASLGGKTLCSLFQSWVMSDSSFPFIYFIDNLDPEIFLGIGCTHKPKDNGGARYLEIR